MADADVVRDCQINGVWVRPDPKEMAVIDTTEMNDVIDSMTGEHIDERCLAGPFSIGNGSKIQRYRVASHHRYFG